MGKRERQEKERRRKIGRQIGERQEVRDRGRRERERKREREGGIEEQIIDRQSRQSSLFV